MLKGIKITLDKFYQYDYIILCSIFKGFFLNRLISCGAINGLLLFFFFFTLFWPVRNQPVNLTCGAVFTSWLCYKKKTQHCSKEAGRLVRRKQDLASNKLQGLIYQNSNLH